MGPSSIVLSPTAFYLPASVPLTKKEEDKLNELISTAFGTIGREFLSVARFTHTQF